MAEIVRMPKLSDTMTEGVVAQWHKKVGDKVKAGDLLAEIETDKATMEFESFQEGTLLYLGVEKGKAAPVDSILAILGKEGEDVSKLVEEDKKKQQEKSSANGKQEKEDKKKEEKKEPVAEKAVKAEAAPPVSAERRIVSNGEGRLKASPLAKKLAKEKGLKLSGIPGTGDGGRVIRRDIENFPMGAAMPFIGVERFTEADVSQMRKTIAKRLAESKFSAPHFYLTIEIDMENMIGARESINEVASAKISYNDLVIKAVAASLRRHPKVNSSWLGDRIRFNEHIHIGVAVAVEEGLLVPVVKFADGKTLSQIAAEVKQFAEKAKNKKLQPQDWEGNTFTISNLGMFGIEEFTAIINPPDACIMAVGGIKQVPVVRNGQIVPGNTMKVTLSCDHRVVDGATGASFLQTFKFLMENPVLLLGAGSI
jgi:pyruvate dehydrogenase E2 component (dihydrolipoamide acetyltransferase)